VNNFTNYKKGFSLIELAVSISIILVITAVVIPNYLTAIEKYELDAVAIDTLLKFRESQVFSISSREGDDTLFGANLRDELHGGPGNDVLVGEYDSQTIR